MIRENFFGTYLGSCPWRKLKCPNCGRKFEAWRNEEDCCPGCNAKFTWVPKLGFYEEECMNCKEFIDIELGKDGSCEVCGTKYKWKKTVPSIFHPKSVNYLMWETNDRS